MHLCSFQLPEELEQVRTGECMGESDSRLCVKLPTQPTNCDPTFLTQEKGSTAQMRTLSSYYFRDEDIAPLSQDLPPLA